MSTALLLCTYTHADAEICSSQGYTVIFVNGILTTDAEAKASQKALETILPGQVNNQKINVRLGYNPTHLGGLGDKIESVTQAFNKPVSNFDLNTILMQLYPEVTTRKILLVGHSQGAFYTNEMYNYLVTHGVPPQSIAVYNIATPASFVAGSGRYITSNNDKVINAVRDAEVKGNVELYVNSDYTASPVVASALRANVTIPKEDGWDADAYGGHHFSVYLDGAGDRIVKDIDAELAKLQTEETGNGAEDCFTPPQPTVGYEAQQALFGVGDALANVSVSLGQGPIQGSLTFLSGTRGLLADVIPSAWNGLKNAFGMQSNRAQAAASVIAVEPSAPAAPSQDPGGPRPTAVVRDEAPPAPEPTETDAESEETPAPAPAQPEPATTPPPPPQQPLFAVSPGFGGGGGGTAASASQNTSQNSVPLSVTSPSDGSYFATTSVDFNGTSSIGARISALWNSQTSSTTADAGGNWSLSFSFPEGNQTVSFTAVDDSGNSSASLSRGVIVDTTPPASPVVAVPDCALSLSQSHCLLPVTSALLEWNDVPDVVSYAVIKNGSAGVASSATSSTLALSSAATTSLAVVAYDAAGNSATSTSLDVSVFAQPLLINEIAWAGDSVDSSHQWIELKNISGETLDLSHVAVARSGGGNILLSGSVPTAIPFVVIESSDIANTGTQKIITPFPALTTGTSEQLSLVWNNTVIDTTPEVSTCSTWCAGKTAAAIGRNESGVGDLISPLSMERAAGSADGSLSSSWHDTDTYPGWILGANYGQVWGTPDSENSSGLPDSGVYCGSSSNLVQSGQPYHLDPGGCVYLMRFVTGGTFGVNREGELYRGTVGSSTIVTGHAFGHALAAQGSDTLPADAQAGEDFFFAIYENRSFGSDVTNFQHFFTQSASTTLGYTAPHGNYVTIPWTYQP